MCVFNQSCCSYTWMEETRKTPITIISISHSSFCRSSCSNSPLKLLLHQIINEHKKPAVFRSHTMSLWRKSLLPPRTWSFKSHKQPCRLKWSALASADRQLHYKSNETLTEGSESEKAAATYGAQIRAGRAAEQFKPDLGRTPRSVAAFGAKRVTDRRWYWWWKYTLVAFYRLERWKLGRNKTSEAED